MDIKNLITYLKEELKDIPAVPKNIHYTSLESLYYILQSGLKGQEGGYKTHTLKTKKDDMELSTVRNSHKITQDEKYGLSTGAGSNGAEIELYTDRILAAHRGTRKTPFAELPISQKKFLDRKAKEFKQRYGIEAPQIFKTEDALGKTETVLDMFTIRDWVNNHIKSANPRLKDIAIDDVYWYNKYLKEYYEYLMKREREERFLLKKGIPADPNLMRIVITADVGDLEPGEEEFLDEVAVNYLKLLKKHEDVIVQNDKLRELKRFLRNSIEGQNK